MSGVLTSTKLINSIKRRAMLPSDQNTFTDEDFLDMINEEIQYFGVPHLLRTHEEYLMVFQDFEFEEGKKYEIPYRALGNKLRELSYVTNVDNLGTASPNEQIFELSRISVEDLPDYNNYFTSQYTDSFYVENNKIVLLGQFQLTDAVLRMHYYLRPNSLVTEDKVGIITSIDTVSGVISLDKFPSDFASSPDMDFIKHQSPNIIMGFDKTPTAVNSTTKTVTFDPDDLPDNLQVGDYLNVAQEAFVPQLPAELHAILAQRVAVAALEALGDREGLEMAQRRLDMMEKSTNDLIDNRVEGAPEKINNRHGTLRDATVKNNYRGRGRF